MHERGNPARVRLPARPDVELADHRDAAQRSTSGMSGWQRLRQGDETTSSWPQSLQAHPAVQVVAVCRRPTGETDEIGEDRPRELGVGQFLVL
jgi:hypothetical protein